MSISFLSSGSLMLLFHTLKNHHKLQGPCSLTPPSMCNVKINTGPVVIKITLFRNRFLQIGIFGFGKLLKITIKIVEAALYKAYSMK